MKENGFIPCLPSVIEVEYHQPPDREPLWKSLLKGQVWLRPLFSIAQRMELTRFMTPISPPQTSPLFHLEGLFLSNKCVLFLSVYAYVTTDQLFIKHCSGSKIPSFLHNQVISIISLISFLGCRFTTGQFLSESKSDLSQGFSLCNQKVNVLNPVIFNLLSLIFRILMF